MRKLYARDIGKIVYDLCLDVNLNLRGDILKCLKDSLPKTEGVSRFFLEILIENVAIAKKKKVALCQDTGLVVVFIEIGKDTIIVGDLHSEITHSVARAYKDAGLRPSVVYDPLNRGSSGYRLSIVHIEYTKSKNTYLTVLAKGFGSENKSKLRMFLPTASQEEIISFVVETVRDAGASACPPFVVGVGIGGTSDKAMFLAKKAITLPIVGKYKGDYEDLANRIKERINKEVCLGILGMGGGPTVLGVNILSYPTHIAGLPVGVNIGCHSTRSKRVKI